MKNGKLWLVGYVIALGLVLLAPLASSAPDGLEAVAEEHGFIDKAQEPPFQIIADYVFPGVENEALATILSGFIGVTVVYALVVGLAFLAYRRVGARAATSPSA